MIGYCEDGVPKVGVVYHATEDIMYYAIKGKGAFSLNKDEKIELKCNDCSAMEAVASVSNQNKPKPLEIISKMKIEKKKVRGSMGLKSMDIAKGDANLYLNLTKKSSFCN
jgi:3'(2'), 5'-bisphosphate nucleotidase